MAKKSQPVRWLRLPKINRWWWYGGAASLIVIIAALASGYTYYYRQRIVPHTVISGVAVGGLTPAQAERVLNDRAAAFAQSNLTLTYQNQTRQLIPSSIGINLQVDQAVAAAYQTGRSGSSARNVASKLKALFVEHRFLVMPAPLTADGLNQLQTAVLKNIVTSVVQTSLKFVPGHVTVVPGQAGEQLDLNQFTSDIASAFAKHTAHLTLRLAAVDPAVAAAQAAGAQAQAEQVLSAGWLLQIGGQNFSISPTVVAGFLSSSTANNRLQLGVDQTKLAAYLSTLAPKIAPAPINATLAVTGGAVSISKDGTPGTGLDATKTAAAITAAVLTPTLSSRTIVGATETVEPAVWSGNFATLGLNQLIGTGTTNFSGSPANRIANIRTGAEAINSQLVAPGAEFSTVGALGPIDAAHGYVSALVIIGGQTLPEDGGGLCQVSTTLFRAVLNAGLTVTARTAHAYEVSYYQRGVGPGLDATIYDPSPDFRWLNNTDHAIYVQSIMTGATLTFNLFGTADGRVATITGPTVLSTSQPSGSPIYVNTDTLPQGKTELIDPPIDGAKTTATYTVTRNGQVINKQVFNSSYKAMPAQYLVGTGPAS